MPPGDAQPDQFVQIDIDSGEPDVRISDAWVPERPVHPVAERLKAFLVPGGGPLAHPEVLRFPQSGKVVRLEPVPDRFERVVKFVVVEKIGVQPADLRAETHIAVIHAACHEVVFPDVGQHIDRLELQAIRLAQLDVLFRPVYLCEPKDIVQLVEITFHADSS